MVRAREAIGAHGQIRDFAIAEQERRDKPLRLLAESGILLAAPVGSDERFQALADMAVPRLADWCVAHAVEPNGAIRLAAAAHRDPAKTAQVRELAWRFSVDGNDASGVARALRKGNSVIWPEAGAGRGPADKEAGRRWARLRALGCEALMIVPLAARGRILGALTLARADAARLYKVADLALAEELARRAALAIDNARLHQAEQQARQAAEAANARLEAQVAQHSRQLREANAALEREVADRQRTEAKLRSSREQLRNLSARLQMVREAERSRVAREILDGFGQTMSALKMEVAWLRQNLGSGEAERLKQRATGALGMIDAAIRTVRQMAADLHPRILDDLGLAAALEWQTQRFERRTGIRCRFMPDVADIRIAPDVATAVFRIYEEIVSNVARHALASRVVVTLQQVEGQLILAVRDNGRSITAEEIASPHSLGLIGMRELARSHNGVLEITGQQGKGTTVTLNIPPGGTAR